MLKIQDMAKNLMNGYIPKKEISIVYYYILEDANFHTENTYLTRNGKFGLFEVHRYPGGNVYVPKSYGKPYAEELYKEYTNAGGKTWDIDLTLPVTKKKKTKQNFRMIDGKRFDFVWKSTKGKQPLYDIVNKMPVAKKHRITQETDGYILWVER